MKHGKLFRAKWSEKNLGNVVGQRQNSPRKSGISTYFFTVRANIQIRLVENRLQFDAAEHDKRAILFTLQHYFSAMTVSLPKKVSCVSVAFSFIFNRVSSFAFLLKDVRTKAFQKFWIVNLARYNTYRLWKSASFLAVYVNDFFYNYYSIINYLLYYYIIY